MGLLTRLAAAIRPPAETRAGDGWAALYQRTGTGGAVTAWQAENLSTVTACINAIAGGLAALPATVYRSLGDTGRIEAPNHPVARLLRAPNRYQTWPDWVEWTVSQMLLQGNALSVIESDGAGRPTALRPVPWLNVSPALLPSGALAYDVSAYQAPWGSSGPTRRFLDTEVFHLRDRSDDGYIGRSRLSRAPDVLNAAIGLQTFSASVWTNSASPSGMVTTGVNPDPNGLKRMIAQFDERNVGAGNAKRVIWADSGSTFTPMDVSPEDAEVLASRRFTVEELCRLFNCPPPIVQSYENSTFTNSAQANTWFATNTLRPIATKIEAEFARSVFADPSGTFHLEIDLSGLMRGDFATRWTANVAAVAAGILSADEVRAAEGYGPKATTGGDPAELAAPV